MPRLAAIVTQLGALSLIILTRTILESVPTSPTNQTYLRSITDTQKETNSITCHHFWFLKCQDELNSKQKTDLVLFPLRFHRAVFGNMLFSFTYKAAFTGLHSRNSEWVSCKNPFYGFFITIWVFGFCLFALEFAAFLLFLLARVFWGCWLWLWEQPWVGFFESLAGFSLSLAHHFGLKEWCVEGLEALGTVEGFGAKLSSFDWRREWKGFRDEWKSSTDDLIVCVRVSKILIVAQKF